MPSTFFGAGSATGTNLYDLMEGMAAVSASLNNGSKLSGIERRYQVSLIDGSGQSNDRQNFTLQGAVTGKQLLSLVHSFRKGILNFQKFIIIFIH